MAKQSKMAVGYRLFVSIFLLILPVVLNAQLPESFDLRDVEGQNYVTSVKTQLGGTCWIHGAVASIESNLLMNGNWTLAGDTGEPNLAEYHIDWWNGFNQFFNGDMDPPEGNDGIIVHQGGQFQIVNPYLTRGEGAVRDIDGQSFGDPPPRTGPDFHYYYVKDIEWCELEEDLSNIDQIKTLLMTRGAIGTYICSDYSLFMDENYVHYQPPDDPEGSDHVIAVVGWDDNKVSAAPYPGCWLCKNSWGDNWALDGFYWVSYYDKYCCKGYFEAAMSYYNVVYSPYDYIYYHDYHGWRSTAQYTIAAFNAFTPPHNGKLLAVNFVTLEDSVDYTIRIYDDFSGGDLHDIIILETGNMAYCGYHTVDLTEPVDLIEGDEFYIYVSLSDGGHAYDASGRLDITAGGKYRAYAQSKSNPGESYYMSGTTWYDLYYDNTTANFCIKGLSMDTYMKVLQDDVMEAEGPSGGPFTPDLTSYQFTHKYDNAIDYQISTGGASDWISLSGGVYGTLDPYDTAEVIIEINSNADTLCDGVHYATINFSNLDDPLDDTVRVVKLVVGTPEIQHQWMLDSDPEWDTEGEWQFGQPTGDGGSFGFGADPISGHTGLNVYGYNLYGNYPNNLFETYLTTPPINCSKLVKTSLKFWRWLCVDGFGYGTIEVSNDAVNWTTVYNCHEWLPDSIWNEMELDISAVADSQATVYIRWMMAAEDALYTFGGWNIDDIQIMGIYNLMGTEIMCGDTNGDETLNLFDITYLISYLYLGGPQPSPIIKADVNSDNEINIFDITYLITYLYLGGPEPDCP